MNSQIVYNFNTFEVSIYSAVSFVFCILALFVLVYYIRRRYKLYKEIKRIPKNLLILEEYKNHLKNLKLKCIINNFITVILLIEIVLNVSQMMMYFPYWIIHYLKEFPLYKELQYYSYLLNMTIRYSFVPVLSMMMDFLWLAYRKYEYKYTIIRWTWYIAIRTFVAFLVNGSFFSNNFILVGYKTIYGNLVNILFEILTIIDFIQFVYYARRFYLQLKSREKEIRLFYFDKKSYLDSKYLRIHFKVATILVGIALFLSALAISGSIITIPEYIPNYIDIPQQLNNYLTILSNVYIGIICNILFTISEVIFIFNYLYIFIAVVYKSYRDRKKLENINDYIRPIMKQYHDNYYN